MAFLLTASLGLLLCLYAVGAQPLVEFPWVEERLTDNAPAAVMLASKKNGRCDGNLQQSLQWVNGAQNIAMAENICCHNSEYAEPSGYWKGTNLIEIMRGNKGPTTFYDSVCGKPLFIAPKGRTLAEFESESAEHGWPSFRPEEWLNENVILTEPGKGNVGEMHSVCGTHLGHNIPDAKGPRACIDLVCISGKPL